MMPAIAANCPRDMTLNTDGAAVFDLEAPLLVEMSLVKVSAVSNQDDGALTAIRCELVVKNL
jgi:hypothetical protein